MNEFIPQREIPRRTLISANVAEEKFRRSILEAAAELSQEFSVCVFTNLPYYEYITSLTKLK